MRSVKFELTPEELTLLVSLASDQLFRREFIDPKMPGYKGDRGEVQVGKALVSRLRGLIVEDRQVVTGPVSGRVAGAPSKRAAGRVEAV